MCVFLVCCVWSDCSYASPGSALPLLLAALLYSRQSVLVLSVLSLVIDSVVCLVFVSLAWLLSNTVLHQCVSGSSTLSTLRLSGFATAIRGFSWGELQGFALRSRVSFVLLFCFLVSGFAIRASFTFLFASLGFVLVRAFAPSLLFTLLFTGPFALVWFGLFRWFQFPARAYACSHVAAVQRLSWARQLPCLFTTRPLIDASQFGQ